MKRPFRELFGLLALCIPACASATNDASSASASKPPPEGPCSNPCDEYRSKFSIGQPFPLPSYVNRALDASGTRMYAHYHRVKITACADGEGVVAVIQYGDRNSDFAPDKRFRIPLDAFLISTYRTDFLIEAAAQSQPIFVRVIDEARAVGMNVLYTSSEVFKDNPSLGNVPGGVARGWVMPETLIGVRVTEKKSLTYNFTSSRSGEITSKLGDLIDSLDFRSGPTYPPPR